MAKEDVTLSLGIQWDAAHFRKAYDESFRTMERAAKKAAGNSDSAFSKLTSKIKQNFTQLPKVMNAAHKGLAAYNKEARIGKKESTLARKEYIDKYKKLTELQRDLNLASAEGRAKALDEIEAQKKAVAVAKERLKTAKDFYAEAQRGADELKDKIEELTFEFSGEKLIEAAGEAGKELMEPLSALLNKDIEGAGKGFAKGIGGMIGKIGGKLGKGISGLGEKASGKADAMKAAGNGGAMAKGLGAIGSLTKGLGSTIQVLSKIGPLLGAVSGAIMGMVKMFIDAQAMVKEFNKDLLANAGTGQFWAKSLGKADLAVANVNETLDGFRNAAYEFNANNDWGISSDQHKEVLANLQAEGISLTRLENEYGQLNKASSAFSKNQGAVTQAMVNYSRSMGVSLSEVTSFQAEMMTEMGASLGSTVKQFRQMSAAAEESGIASNKFFAMIRGVSADLNMYNSRLETAVKFLGKLGTVMSPKNAQKFMQTAMNAYKGMSFQDKVKASLLAGPQETAKIVAADVEQKSTAISEDIARAIGGKANDKDIKKILEEGNKDKIKALMDQVAPDKKGAINEAVVRLGIERKRSKKGLTGNAAALSQVDVFAAAEHQQKAASHFGKLTDGAGGIGAEVSGQPAGVDDETRINGEIMAAAMENQRDAAYKMLKEQNKLGKATNAQELTWSQIGSTMTKAEQDAAKNLDVEEEANKRIGTVTQSVMDKLSLLTDWFMNQFYNVICQILDGILSLPGQDRAKRDDLRFMKEMGKVKDPAVQAALAEAGKADPGKAAQAFRDALMGDPVWKEISTFMTTPQADPKQEEKRQDMIKKSLDNLTDAQLTEAAKAAGVDLATTGEVKSRMVKRAGGEYDTVTEDTRKVDRSKLTDDQKAKLAEKSGWAAGGSTGFATMFKDLNDTMHARPAGEAAAKGGEVGEAAGLQNATDDAKKEAVKAAPGKAGKMSEEEMMAQFVDNTPTPPPAKAGSPAAGPVMGTPKSDPAAIKEGKDLSKKGEDQIEKQEAIQGTLAEVVSALRQKGIRLDKSWMDNHMKKMFEEASLDALRVALLEYFLYQDVGAKDVAKALNEGIAPKDLGKGLVDALSTGKADNTADAMKTLKKNAEGGMVTAVRGGMAQVSPAPGEGLASIGRGEQIMPAGSRGAAESGGSTRVELVLKGDLANLIDARVQEGIVKHNMASKFR